MYAAKEKFIEMTQVVAGAHRTGKEHVTSHVHSIDGEIQTWRTFINIVVSVYGSFMTKQETFSTLNHVMARALAS